MNCSELQDLFSDLFENRLEAVARARAREHLAGCAGCRADFESFRAATAALRANAAAPTPRAYVDAVLAAVEEQSRSVAVPVPWLRWATHLAAAAAGALFAFLWLQNAPSTQAEPTAADVAQPTPAEPELQLQLAAGSGRLDRDGRTSELAPDQTVTLRAGDVLRAERIAALELSLDERGRLLLALPAFVAPPLQVVERIVERIVERPVEVIREVPVDGPGSQAIARELERGVAVLEDGFAALRDALRAEAPALESQAGGAAVAARTEEPAETVAAAEFAPDLPAVRIRREGDRLSLDTRGPLTEIVPTLIAQLKSDDPEVVELVQRRLAAIRDETLDSTGWVEPAAVAERARSTSSASLTELLFGKDGASAEPELDRAERWSVWWEAQAPRLADAEGERVF
jgi:hypothetical protein